MGDGFGKRSHTTHDTTRHDATGKLPADYSNTKEVRKLLRRAVREEEENRAEIGRWNARQQRQRGLETMMGQTQQQRNRSGVGADIAAAQFMSPSPHGGKVGGASHPSQCLEYI